MTYALSLSSRSFYFAPFIGLIIPLTCLLFLFISRSFFPLNILEFHLIEQGMMEKTTIFIYALTLFFLGTSNLKPFIKNIFLMIVLFLMITELDLLSESIEDGMVTIGFYMDKKIPFFIRALIAPFFLAVLFFFLYNFHRLFRFKKYLPFKSPYSYTLMATLCCIILIEIIALIPDFIEQAFLVELSSNLKVWNKLIEEVLEFSMPLLLLLGLWQYDQLSKKPKMMNWEKRNPNGQLCSPSTFRSSGIPLERLFIITLLSGVCGLIVFMFYPQLDLFAAAPFYTETGDFSFKEPTLGYHLRHLLMEIYGYVILIAIFGCLYSWQFKKSFFSKTNRQMLFFLAVITIGPGLVANLGFKSNWGRARPVHVQEFGGPKTFTPPYVISHNCRKNCSFVSGEASNFFALFFGLALISRRFWKPLFLSGIGAGLFAGYIRMGAGGHFLSDVFFAGIFMSLTCLFLYWLLRPNTVPT